ncbi:hypothetical protein D3C80_1112550 [compost metagenome]
MVAPGRDVLGALHRPGHFHGAGEAHGLQALQALVHPLRPVRPVPDEQADAGGIARGQVLAIEQPGHLAAGAPATLGGLHMGVQPPVEFALQHAIADIW